MEIDKLRNILMRSIAAYTGERKTHEAVKQGNITRSWNLEEFRGREFEVEDDCVRL